MARTSFLRATLFLQTGAVLLQACTAGLLLSSRLAYEVHDAGSKVMYGATLLYLTAAVLAWRTGGASPRHVRYALGFLVLVSAQVVTGVLHVPGVHVPLGAVIFGLSLLTLFRENFQSVRHV
ncbi:hypothetical protein AB0G79_10860 [Streptomyces sp. NPDC020807]|uniref:hypothetical protein n=1 Tax=Streptomyces sp. NPDC020807 TaxID=3155119 RepID=UPI0033F9F9E0